MATSKTWWSAYQTRAKRDGVESDTQDATTKQVDKAVDNAQKATKEMRKATDEFTKTRTPKAVKASRLESTTKKMEGALSNLHDTSPVQKGKGLPQVTRIKNIIREKKGNLTTKQRVSIIELLAKADDSINVTIKVS